MQSFKSRELVKERFAWRHYYWFLTPKGVEYLREYLNLPEDIVPATHKQRARGDRPGGPQRRFEDRGPPPEGRDFRGGYREGPSATEKVKFRKIHTRKNTGLTVMSCRKEQQEIINRNTSALASDVVADFPRLLRDEILPPLDPYQLNGIALCDWDDCLNVGYLGLDFSNRKLSHNSPLRNRLIASLWVPKIKHLKRCRQNARESLMIRSHKEKGNCKSRPFLKCCVCCITGTG